MTSDLLSKLPFDGSMWAILAAFFLTYLIGRYFLYLPVLDLLEEREREITEAEAAFTGARAEVEAELEEQRAKMAEERAAARAQRDAIRREALSVREEKVAETQKLTEQKLEAAGRELAELVESEGSALRSNAQALADLMASKVMRKAS